MFPHSVLAQDSSHLRELSHDAPHQTELLMGKVRLAFVSVGTHHEFQNELTMSTEVPLYNQLQIVWHILATAAWSTDFRKDNLGHVMKSLEWLTQQHSPYIFAVYFKNEYESEILKIKYLEL